MGKDEKAYLRAQYSGGDARASLARHIEFFNVRRPHSSLDRRTPNKAYFHRPPLLATS